MSDVDVSKIETISVTPNPKNRCRTTFGEFGETITVRDFYQNVVGTVHIMANGQFHAPEGTIKPEDLGQYILRIAGHPRR